MAEETHQDVLRETVAQMLHPRSDSCEIGVPVGRRDSCWNELEGTVAFVEK